MATPSPCFLPTLVAPEQWWVLKSLTIMETSLPHGFLEWHIGYLCNFHLHGEFSGCNYPLQLIKSDVITEVLLAVPLHIQVGVCGSLEFQSWALLTHSPTHCCRLGESFLRWHSHSLLQHTLWGPLCLHGPPGSQPQLHFWPAREHSARAQPLVATPNLPSSGLTLNGSLISMRTRDLHTEAPSKISERTQTWTGHNFSAFSTMN